MKREPMYITIYKDILAKIDAGSYTDALPTELELTKQYGVSRITVQKSLKMLTDMNRVKRIAGRGTYVLSSEELLGANSGLIGVVFCHMSSSYGMDILLETERAAQKHGFSVVFKNSYDNPALETRAIDDLLGLGVRGIIIQPVHGENFNEKILELSLKKFPIVLLDRNLKGLDISFIGTDNRFAVEKMMDYLFECGHRNIAFASSKPYNASTIEERIDAVRLSFLKHGIPYDDKFLFTGIESTSKLPVTEKDIEQDIGNIYAYLQENPQITCVFCCEHAIAQLVYRAAARMGKKMPEDLGIVCFDAEINPFNASRFTHIRQNQQLMAQKAVSKVDELAKQKTKNEKVYLEADLVFADSVRRV